jgi:hypothetical protein
LRAETALDVPDHILAIVGIQPAAFPAGIRIVDPPVHAAAEKAERVRYPHDQPATIGPKCEQRIGIGAVGDWHVQSEPERIEAIDEVNCSSNGNIFSSRLPL